MIDEYHKTIPISKFKKNNCTLLIIKKSFIVHVLHLGFGLWAGSADEQVFMVHYFNILITFMDENYCLQNQHYNF